MEILIIAAIVALIPVTGLLVSKSRIACSVWAVIFVFESALIGWFFGALAIAWRWDGPMPANSPQQVAIELGILATIASILIILILPGVLFSRFVGAMRNRTKRAIVAPETPFEWKTLNQISFQETKSESGRGDGVSPVTPPTPPDMRVRIRRFQSDDGGRP